MTTNNVARSVALFAIVAIGSVLFAACGGTTAPSANAAASTTTTVAPTTTTAKSTETVCNAISAEQLLDKDGANDADYQQYAAGIQEAETNLKTAANAYGAPFNTEVAALYAVAGNYESQIASWVVVATPGTAGGDQVTLDNSCDTLGIQVAPWE